MSFSALLASDTIGLIFIEVGFVAFAGSALAFMWPLYEVTNVQLRLIVALQVRLMKPLETPKVSQAAQIMPRHRAPMRTQTGPIRLLWRHKAPKPVTQPVSLEMAA